MLRIANITSTFRSRLIVDTYKFWLKPNQKILDVGCGTGVAAAELSNRLKLNIVGCDIDKYLIVKIPFRKMSREDKLPFRNKSFEVVMFNDVLHHTSYKNQSKLLKEALRVSKSVLLFELVPTTIGRIVDFVINKIHHFKMEIPFTYRRVEGWKKLFKNLGLKYQVVIVQRPFWYPFSHVAFVLTKTLHP